MRIKSHAPWMWLGMTAASVPVLFMSGAFVYLMRQDGRDGWLVYTVMTPFLIVGVLLAWFGLRALLQLARRGSWQLEVPDTGLVLGGPMEAALFTSRERRPSGDLTCHLRCLRIIHTAGTSGSRGTSTLWETTWPTSSAVIQPSLGLRLILPFPAAGEPTSIDRKTGSGVQWQLNVIIPSLGFSEQPVFDLPVRPSSGYRASM